MTLTESVVGESDWSKAIITAEELAERLGLAETTIKMMMRKGLIPCVKITNKRVMTVAQWVLWLRQLETQATTVAAVGSVEPF